MALRWIEGFETALGDTQLARRWGAASSGINGASPRVSGMGRSGNDLTGNVRHATGTFTSENTWILQFGWRLDGLMNQTVEGGVILYDASGEQLRLLAVQHSDVGDTRWRIQVKRGSTVLDESGPLWTDQWYYIKFKATVHDTTGSFELQVDGVTVASDAGPIDTADQGTPGVTRFDFRFQHASQVVGQFDDILIMDDTGSTFNDFVTNKIVLGIFPNGDHTTDWETSSGSTHYVLVDDPAGSPSESDFVQSEDSADVDLWDYEDLEELDALDSPPSVRAVSLETTAALNGSGSRTIRAKYRNGSGGGTIINGSNVVLSDGTVRLHREVWEDNPDTAAAWTITEVEGAQFGVELVS